MIHLHLRPHEPWANCGAGGVERERSELRNPHCGTWVQECGGLTWSKILLDPKFHLLFTQPPSFNTHLEIRKLFFILIPHQLENLLFTLISKPKNKSRLNSNRIYIISKLQQVEHFSVASSVNLHFRISYGTLHKGSLASMRFQTSFETYLNWTASWWFFKPLLFSDFLWHSPQGPFYHQWDSWH